MLILRATCWTEALSTFASRTASSPSPTPSHRRTGEAVYDAARPHRHSRPTRSPCAFALGGSRFDVDAGRPTRRAQPERPRSRAGRCPVGADGWVRAVGYHEAVAGPLDRAALDEVSPPVPVRVQHRSGVLWTLNSAGLARMDFPSIPTAGCAVPTRLVEHVAAQRDRAARSQPAAVSSRRHRRHRRDAGLRCRRHREADRGPPPRRADQRVHCLAPGKQILHDTDLDLDLLPRGSPIATPTTPLSRCTA